MPNKYNKFNLVDTHDDALTFDNTPSGDTAYALYDGDTLIASENYQVTEQTNGFTVAVDPAFIPFFNTRRYIKICLLHASK